MEDITLVGVEEQVAVEQHQQQHMQEARVVVDLAEMVQQVQLKMGETILAVAGAAELEEVILEAPAAPA
jgi:hypothetical protein